MTELRLGIAGLGYWGPNLVRNFRSINKCRVSALADTDPARLMEMGRLCPEARLVESAEELIADPAIDAVVLALPARLLPPLAIKALGSGKHVMVEKPMADSLVAGSAMLDAARQTDRINMVDFTFVYSPPVDYLRSLLRAARLGPLRYYQSTRVNLGRFQPDIDVIWDLVVHDVAILTYLLEKIPSSVMAVSQGTVNTKADTAHVTLTYDDGFQAFIQVSWLAPIKVRTSVLTCHQGMVVYNDVEPDEKIRVYQLQQQFDPSREEALVPTFRLGDVLIPQLPQEEPLKKAARTFVEAGLEGGSPPTDWFFGVQVLAVLDAARRSVATGQVTPVVVSEEAVWTTRA